MANVATSKTGKHGHAKCNFTAIDIFTNKKYEDVVPGSHSTSVPNVVRKEYSLVDLSEDDFCSLMNADGDVREDVKLPEYPEGFAREIRELFASEKSYTVSVMAAMGHEQIIHIKEDTS